MTAMIRSWWQQIKQHPYATVVVVVLVLILFIFLAYRFDWDWTGFSSGTSQITITGTSKGNYSAIVSQPSKSVWDWLNLLGVLAIPAVVALGAAWYTAQQGEASKWENKDNQHEVALQEYINRMSELLDKQLRLSPPEEDMRIVARARTLSVLRRLNSERKGNVIQFLSESHLLSTRIVDLSFAELSEANLYRAQLINANLFSAGLKKANLCQADLRFANLSEAYLVDADLRGARLCYADLRGTNLSKADLRGADLSRAKLDGVKPNETLYNKEKIQMRSPYWEEPLHLEPTCFPDDKYEKPDGFKHIDCRAIDRREVCQKKEDQSGTPVTERRIDLSFSDLRNLNLSSKDFSEANLYQAKLNFANLTNADLSNANLSNAKLSNADFNFANLTGANLKDATGITIEELEKQARSLAGAIMPDGSIHP